MEHAIGTEIILLDGRKANVVEDPTIAGCTKCFLDDYVGMQMQSIRTHRPQEHNLQRNQGGIDMGDTLFYFTIGKYEVGMYKHWQGYYRNSWITKIGWFYVYDWQGGLEE